MHMISGGVRLHRYEEIAAEVRASIESGAYGMQGKLPSERWLGRSFRAHRNTIRQALAILEGEGIVTSVGKSGWFIPSSVAIKPQSIPSNSRVMLVTFRRPSGPSIESIATGLREVLTAAGIQMLHYDSAGPMETQHIATIEELTTVDAAGIVMWPHHSVDSSLLSRLQSSANLVLVDRRVFGFEADSVIFDDLSAGRMVTDHLIANGHRRIAFLADEPFVESVQSRWNGYRQSMELAGIEPDDHMTILTFGRHEPMFTGNVDMLLQCNPTAIVCSNDSVASTLLLILRSKGLNVPGDIAVVGFGNDASGYLDVIGLTTMAQPFVEFGRIAGRLLIERLTGPRSGKATGYKQILVPMSLVVRQSSGRSIQ